MNQSKMAINAHNTLLKLLEIKELRGLPFVEFQEIAFNQVFGPYYRSKEKNRPLPTRYKSKLMPLGELIMKTKNKSQLLTLLNTQSAKDIINYFTKE